MLPSFLRSIWGDLSNEELKKFGILSGIFFLILGAYYILKTSKDGIFGCHVGIAYQPIAKIASIIVIGLVVIFYSKLVDLFRKTTVFYIICGFFGSMLLLLGYFLNHPQLLVATPGSWLALIPGNILGWAAYLFIECFGSIMPALFWAYVASSTTTESAKRGYSMILTVGQVGSVIGAFVVSSYSRTYGLPIFFGVSGIIAMIIPFIIQWYSNVVPQPAEEVATKGGGSGFFEGLRLLLTHRYLLGIFAIVTLYEFIGAILDFQMKLLTDSVYPSKIGGGAEFATFQGWYNTSIGTLSLIFAFFGSFFMRKFGLRACLVAFPTIIGLCCLIVFFGNAIGASTVALLWTFFGVMVLIKGAAYALNKPTAEVLYIPTSKDVKFKTKGWIDAFGARLLKGAGAGVNNTLASSLQILLSVGTILSLGVVGAWIFIAYFVSTSFDTLQKENKIIK